VRNTLQPNPSEAPSWPSPGTFSGGQLPREQPVPHHIDRDQQGGDGDRVPQMSAPAPSSPTSSLIRRLTEDLCLGAGPSPPNLGSPQRRGGTDSPADVPSRLPRSTEPCPFRHGSAAPALPAADARRPRLRRDVPGVMVEHLPRECGPAPSQPWPCATPSCRLRSPWAHGRGSGGHLRAC
jgi:hypothetical protein